MATIKERQFLFPSEEKSMEKSAEALKLAFFGSGIIEMLGFLKNGEKLEESWKKHFKRAEDLLDKALKGKVVADNLLVKGFNLTDLKNVEALNLFQELNHFSISHDKDYSQRWTKKVKEASDWDKAHANLLRELKETSLKIIEEKEIEPEKLAAFESIFKSMSDSNMNKLARPVDKFIVEKTLFKGK